MNHRRQNRVADPREQPSYSVAEVAHYLNVPGATIRYWARGRDIYLPLIDVPDHRPTLLSFFNLAELHVLAAIRRRHAVPMPKVRDAIEWLTRHADRASDKRHPLIGRQLDTDGLDLFVDYYGNLVNISQDGQIAMREVMSAALRRIDRDPKGVPVRLFPFTRNSISDAPTSVVIDPRLSAGRPGIAGTGIATEIVAERYKAGESVAELARDSERSGDEIEEAIRCELPAAA